MNWKEIELAQNQRYYLHKGQKLFDKDFSLALKFKAPGLAAVLDETGAYHIKPDGLALYSERYDSSFGFYEGRAAVGKAGFYWHLDEQGKNAYAKNFAWVGNFQEKASVVRDFDNKYFHIDLNGNTLYPQRFIYIGDFKAGYACACLAPKVYVHIDQTGKFLYEHFFEDLGIFHKNFATAKDSRGWHHIDLGGRAIYSERYAMVEPFYNGCALVETLEGRKGVIDERGCLILDF